MSRRYDSRTYNGYGNGAASVASNAQRIQTMAQRVEVKSMDTISPDFDKNGNPQSINVYGNFSLHQDGVGAGFADNIMFTLLNNVTQGTGAWNRIGRKIQMKSIYLQGFFEPSATKQNENMEARVAIIYDKQCNGLRPNYDTVYRAQVSNATDTSAQDITTHLNMNQKDRFEVIADHLVVLPIYSRLVAPDADANYGHVIGNTGLTIELFRKLKNRETIFKSAAQPRGSITDIASGSLLLLHCSNRNFAGSGWEMNATIRLRFYDS